MPKNILLVENNGADFFKYRLRFAEYLINEGFNVFILVPDDGYVKLLKDKGLTVFYYQLERNKNFLKQVYLNLIVYKKLLKKADIHIVHSFRFFPNLINVLANIFSQKRKKIIHVTGLGIVYSNNSFKYRIYKLVSNICYFFMICASDITIVQNPDDLNDLLFFPFMKRKIKLIKGSGVDTDFFKREAITNSLTRKYLGFKDNDLIFVCVTRLIWEKGVHEMVEAFKKLNVANPNIQLLIVGKPDENNPRKVSDEYIAEANKHSGINFIGARNDVREILALSDVFIFPSYYREGIPRGILEALAMGMPLIVADMPGCNLTVINTKNGFLVKPRSENDIYEKVTNEFTNRLALKRMGEISRDLAEREFSDKIIYRQIEKLYTLIN